MRYFNRAKFTFADTGTGNPTVYLADGYDLPNPYEQFPYVIVQPGTTDFEHGVGKIMGSGPYTFSRDVILRSSSFGSKVNFSAGEKVLVGAVLAELMPVSHYDEDSNGLEIAYALDGGTAIGAGSSASECSVSAGRSASSFNKSISLGYRSTAELTSISIGSNPDADRFLSGATAFDNAIAIGGAAKAKKSIAIGVGTDFQAGNSDPGRAGIAIGHHVSRLYNNEAQARPAVIIGDNAVGMEGGVTLGHDTKANWPHCLTWGVGDDPGDTSAAQVHYTVSGGTVQTTNATATGLGFFCNTYNPLTGIYTGAVLFQADVIGIDSANNIAAIRITGTMRYGGIVGTPTVTSIGKSTALSAATAAVSYSSNSLYLSVTGVAGKTIRWGATVTATWIAPRF